MLCQRKSNTRLNISLHLLLYRDKEKMDFSQGLLKAIMASSLFTPQPRPTPLKFTVHSSFSEEEADLLLTDSLPWSSLFKWWRFHLSWLPCGRSVRLFHICWNILCGNIDKFQRFSKSTTTSWRWALLHLHLSLQSWRPSDCFQVYSYNYWFAVPDLKRPYRYYQAPD